VTQIFTYWNDSGFYQNQLIKAQSKEKMLAILGNLASQKSEVVLEQIVHEIEIKSTSELEQGRYFRQLRVLLQLRNLNKKAIKDMALVGKIFKEEKDILYRRGEIMGEMRGEHKKAVEMALKLKARNTLVDEIAELTGLSKKEIQTL